MGAVRGIQGVRAESVNVVNHAIAVEAVPPCGGGGAHPGPQPWVVEQALHRGRQCPLVPGGDQHAGAPVIDDLTQPAGGSCEHGSAAGESLGRGEAEVSSAEACTYAAAER